MSKKINVISHSRFHMLDLARELHNNGFDVRFYSFIPKSRMLAFGLPSECCVSMFWCLFPLLALSKYIRWFDICRRFIQDVLLAIFMRHSDVTIALTGFIYAPKAAIRHGAIYICERGSKHILEQNRIISQLPGQKKKVPKLNISLNLKAYAIADFVSVASKHVAQSFVNQSYKENKLFINPYGVDLSSFYPMPDVPKIYDVIMVGGWSLRKGCDLIVEAIRNTGLKFLHVGGIVDLPFPHDANFTHIPAVDQKRLVEYYAQAKVFVLPSREEGLAMVQAQAIACNLPLVGSPDSGAEDLRNMVANPEYIEIVEDYTPDALINAINKLLILREQKPIKSYAGDVIKNLTWEAYGKRYADFLRTIIGKI